MNRKLKINPAARIAAILFLILAASGQADAGRLTRAPMMIPKPGPPPQVLYENTFNRWSSPAVIKAFKDNGLEVVNIQKGVTMGFSSARETTIFLIPSAGENIGGFVSSYSSKKALETDRKYYSGMNRPSALPAWRIFRKENILLFISGKVPEGRAVRYQKALDQLL